MNIAEVYQRGRISFMGIELLFRRARTCEDTRIATNASGNGRAVFGRRSRRKRAQAMSRR